MEGAQGGGHRDCTGGTHKGKNRWSKPEGMTKGQDLIKRRPRVKTTLNLQGRSVRTGSIQQDPLPFGRASGVLTTVLKGSECSPEPVCAM